MELSMTAPRVKKGRFTNARTANYYEFVINPNHISEKRGSEMGRDNTPGFSDPLIRFASGKLKTVVFKLELSGEMTFRRQRAMFPNELHFERNVLDNYSIRGELEFLESMTYATDPEQGGNGELDLFIFSFGDQKSTVVVPEYVAELLEFDPNLNPTRAEVTLTLERVQDTNIYATDVWRGL